MQTTTTYGDKYQIKHNGKHVKYFTASSVKDVNRECRLLEQEHKQAQYSVKAELVAIGGKRTGTA